MKRNEIRWASLDPVKGLEMAKTRPVVVIGLDTMISRLSTVTVCLLTTKLHPEWRSRLAVRVSRRDADIAVDQIRTLDKSRIGEKLGSLSDKEAAALRRLISEMYGE